MPGALGPDPELCPSCGKPVGNSAVICLDCGCILVRSEDVVGGFTRQQVRRMRFYQKQLGDECAPTRAVDSSRSWSEIMDALEREDDDDGA